MKRTALALVGGVLAAACSLLTSYDGFERDQPIDAASPPIDAGDAEAPADPCAHARWPDPPSSSASGSGAPLVGAASTLSVIAPEASRPLGFDLDRLCTCPDRGACVGALAQAACDPVDSGIDNAGDQLFRAFVSAGVAVDDTGLRFGLASGQYGIVFRLTDYNGAPDDDAVRLDVFNAVGLEGDAGGPAFDGNDTWTLDSESFAGSIPTYGSRAAYVRGGVLVADFAQLLLKMRIPTVGNAWLLIELELRSAVVVARVQQVGPGGLALTDGILAGRMPSSSLLRQAQRGGACVGTSVYDAVKARVCDARDLPIEPGKDGREETCEALSTAIGFRASPSRTSSAQGTRADPSPCPLMPGEDCR